MKIEIKNIAGYAPKVVVCYSGGHSSAICAINAVLRHGKENVILLNHDLSPEVESADIKRFKVEVADYLGMDITYANHPEWETMTPNKLALKRGGFKFTTSPILCTYDLKTKPFYDWIKENDPEHIHTYIYGFDNTPAERVRMNKRIAVMGEIGCKTDYPFITWGELSVTETEQVGIERPNTYDNFAHANCKGCHKAGWQHWYIVYVHERHLWEEMKQVEAEVGHSLKRDEYFEDKEPLFEQMLKAGVPTTEHIQSGKFWADAKKAVREIDQFELFDMQQHDEVACTSCTG